MRVAALYDIHGNLPALEAVLREVRGSSIDLVIVGGDVFPGPMSSAALQCLLDLDLPLHFLRGNGEREVLATAQGMENPNLPAKVRQALRWEAERLTGEEREILASWPKSLQIVIPGWGSVLFCHATPQSDTVIFTGRTPEARLLKAFEDWSGQLVVCGHTHMQFDRRIGTTRVINAGSVGMPFGEPGAYWLFLESGDVKLRRTDYDLQDAAERIRHSGYPQAEDFAANNVLQPPSAEEILAAFQHIELR